MKLVKTFNSILCLLVILASSTLFGQYVPGKSYYGAHNYIEYIAGDLPIILAFPHAGDSMPAHLPNIDNRGKDNGTFELAYLLYDSFPSKTGGCRPHIIINHLHPNKLNAARDSTEAAGTNAEALNAYNEFHNFIEDAKLQINQTYGKGHYFDMHGNGHASEWNEIGLGVSKQYLNHSDSVIRTRLNYSTVKNLCTAGGADFIEVVKGPTSLGGLLQARNWKSVPSPVHPDLDTLPFFYAGWNTWKHGSKDSGTIDATHVESYWAFMVLSANREKYANDLTLAMLDFMEIHYELELDCSTNSIKGMVKETENSFYPNPYQSGNLLKIRSSQAIESISLHNSFGQVHSILLRNGNTIRLNVPAGLYVLTITNKDGTKISNKLLIK